jgi:hypothetical protein
MMPLQFSGSTIDLPFHSLVVLSVIGDSTGRLWVN